VGNFKGWTEGKPRYVGRTRISGVSPKAAPTPATRIPSPD
jgi:hypothetical protein